MSASDPQSLTGLARRAAEHPYFLGFALAAYQARHRLDDAQAAERLGCPAAALPRLRLCRRPIAAEPDFAARVRRIAAYVPCDADALLALLRETSVLAALGGALPADVPASLFTAARDRRPENDADDESQGRDQPPGPTP